MQIERDVVGTVVIYTLWTQLKSELIFGVVGGRERGGVDSRISTHLLRAQIGDLLDGPLVSKGNSVLCGHDFTENSRESKMSIKNIDK